MKLPFDLKMEYGKRPIAVLGKYKISIDPVNFRELLELSTKGYSRIFLLTDSHLLAHQRDTINMIQELPGYAAMISIKAGEKQKNWRNLDRILTSMLTAGLDRNSLLIAFGGGVVGDMGALAASLFMRGIGCLMIPTSLLAMVDSSVGGKTAVNHPLGKNLIGTFYQPSAVIIKTEFLNTLPPRHLLNGMAEVIKYGYIFDEQFLEFLKVNFNKIISVDSSDIYKIIAGFCCSAKAKIVEADEFEGGVRKYLNLGHTFGHALESYYQYKYILHGEAINIGMLIANIFAEVLGLVNKGYFQNNIELHQLLKPKIRLFLDAEEDLLIKRMTMDKKSMDGNIHLVLPDNFGVRIVNHLSTKEILKILSQSKKMLH